MCVCFGFVAVMLCVCCYLLCLFADWCVLVWLCVFVCRVRCLCLAVFVCGCMCVGVCFCVFVSDCMCFGFAFFFSVVKSVWLLCVLVGWLVCLFMVCPHVCFVSVSVIDCLCLCLTGCGCWLLLLSIVGVCCLLCGLLLVGCDCVYGCCACDSVCVLMCLPGVYVIVWCGLVLLRCV